MLRDYHQGAEGKSDTVLYISPLDLIVAWQTNNLLYCLYEVFISGHLLKTDTAFAAALLFGKQDCRHMLPGFSIHPVD